MDCEPSNSFSKLEVRHFVVTHSPPKPKSEGLDRYLCTKARSMNSKINHWYAILLLAQKQFLLVGGCSSLTRELFRYGSIQMRQFLQKCRIHCK